jgi:hypothetical protein
MRKFGLVVLALVGLFVFLPWLRGSAYFGNQEWGDYREEVRENLASDNRFIAETDEFILAEYRFGLNENKLLYAIYVFPGGTNRLYMGIYFSMPDELETIRYDEFVEAMINGYGDPESRDSESARWVTDETIVELKKGKILRADARNRQASFEKGVDELLFDAINKFDEIN